MEYTEYMVRAEDEHKRKLLECKDGNLLFVEKLYQYDMRLITSAYKSLLYYFDEDDFDFDISDEKKSYGIRFVIHNNFYKDGIENVGEIQYNVGRNNLVDWNTHLYISLRNFIDNTSDLEDLFNLCEYATWTDTRECGRRHPYDGWISNRRRRN